MNSEEKRIFKLQWNQVEVASKDKISHAKQVSEIVSKFDFDCFIDCGIGYAGSESWSINALKPDCKIIGFEPHHERYDMIAENNFPGTLLKLGVGETESEVEGFMGYKGGKSDFWLHGSEKLIEEGHYIKGKITLTTVDKVLSEHPEIEKVFIWADIEGSELDMIKGCVKSLESGKIIGFNLELRAHRADEGHCTGQEVIDFLAKYGFENLSGAPTSHPKDFLFKKK